MKSERNRQIQVNNNWRYFKADCKKKLLEEKTGSIYRKRKIEVEPVFGHLKAQLALIVSIYVEKKERKLILGWHSWY